MARTALDDVDLVIKTMATTIVDNADYFAQLDAVAGDGDFGYLAEERLRGRRRRLRHLRPYAVSGDSQEGRFRHLGQGRRRERPHLGNRLPSGCCRRRRQDGADIRRRHRHTARRHRRDHATRRGVARRQDAARLAGPRGRQPRRELQGGRGRRRGRSPCKTPPTSPSRLPRTPWACSPCGPGRLHGRAQPRLGRCRSHRASA